MTQQIYEKRKNKLINFYKNNKYIPSYEELKELFDVSSKSTVYNYVQKFIAEGLIDKTETGRLVPTNQIYQTKVLGTVQAGFPGSEDQEKDNTMSLDEYLIEDPTSTFMLKVSGDSMINEGIREGDMVLVDRGKTPQQNDIVIARIENEWTMKYFIKNNNTAYLKAANEEYDDFYPDEDEELVIGGVVVSVVRKYK